MTKLEFIKLNLNQHKLLTQRRKDAKVGEILFGEAEIGRSSFLKKQSLPWRLSVFACDFFVGGSVRVCA
jgi:hypothetical protein